MAAMRKINILFLLGFSVLLGGASVALADESGSSPLDGNEPRAALATAQKPLGIEAAKGERLAAAVGHYARARSLILAAIREFDSGKRLATPDVLLDSAEWRSSLIDRATELEKVLDPQPRLTNGGVRYQPDTRLLGEANR
jgi:hypothetical protein